MFPIGMGEMLADSAALFPSSPAPSGALKWRSWLIGTVILQAILCFMRFAIDDIWGGITDLVLLVIAYFVIFDMTVMYILWYMVLCGMNFAFNMVYLSVRMVELKKDFFSRSHHPMENMTSAIIVAAPILAAWGVYVGWQMYSYWEPCMDNFEDSYEGEAYGAACHHVPSIPEQPILRPFSGQAHRLDDDE